MKPLTGDPFGERNRASLRARLNVLGGTLTFESADASLLRLAVEAFGGLPRHRLGPEPRRFRVSLVRTIDDGAWPHGADPPRPAHSSGGGLLCAMVDAANFAIVDVAMGRALVCISPRLLRRAYHARYELIELAGLTLASRGQALVPLHAACVGARGSGVLLMGSTGAGKSVLTLHALDSGMQVLSDDSAFVAVDSLLVTGVPNFLHVQSGALRFLPEGPLLRQVRLSPTIRRRSGAHKHEVDLRAMSGQIAARPLDLAATVFLSPHPAGHRPPLRRLGAKALLSRLRREQPYAAGLPNWRAFERRIVAVPAYELRRAGHPDRAVEELRALLAAARIPR
jgi:hypothetical protein